MYQTNSNIPPIYSQETRYNYVKNSGFCISTSTEKERDSETGYSYFGARFYDSDLMTGWLSVDPLADKYPSLSPYAYCAWNPIKLVDPDGEEIAMNTDWYKNNRTGDVRWAPGHNKTITDMNGDTYSNIGETYSYQTNNGEYVNCFQNCIVSKGEKCDVYNLAYKDDNLRCSLLSSESPLPEIHKKDLFNSSVRSRGTQVDMVAFCVSGNLVVGGGYTFELMGGIVANDGFFLNFSIGGGSGVDASINASMCFGTYLGENNPSVSRLKGPSVYSSFGLFGGSTQTSVSLSEKDRWVISSFGLSFGSKNLLGGGSMGISYSF